MTTDHQKDQASGASNIPSQEELSIAVQKELGAAAGYLDLKYREWCIQQPDEVCILKWIKHLNCLLNRNIIECSRVCSESYMKSF